MENRASHYFDGFFKAQHLQSEVHMQTNLALVETKMGKFRICTYFEGDHFYRVLQVLIKNWIFTGPRFFFLLQNQRGWYLRTIKFQKSVGGKKPKRLSYPCLRKNQIILANINDIFKRVGLDLGDKVWSNYETKNRKI